MKALGYLRVSTADQGESGAGLEAQRQAIQNEAERRLWTLIDVHQDVASGASTKKRPELARVLERLEAGDAEALIVARLSRLARSTADILHFIELSNAQGWQLVPIDYPQLDTTGAIGKLLVTVVAAVDQFQRELGAENTREALAALKAQGKRLGRPPLVDPALKARLTHSVEHGASYNGLARLLNAEGIPTPTGKEWSHGTVRSVVTGGKPRTTKPLRNMF